MRAIVVVASLSLLVACGSDHSKNNLPRIGTSRIAPRIVGGSASTSAQDAAVYLGIGEDGSCTGTLIAPNLVLTARHCVSEVGDGGKPECGVFTYDLPASKMSVRLGVYASDEPIAARAVKIHRPAGVDGCDDIALVQLDRLITQVAPALVRFTLPAVGETTVAVGYGEDGYGWVRSKRYQRANLPLQAVGPVAFDYVTKHGYSFSIDVPAKTIATGESTCYGDSGGPLFDAKGAVIGVTSRGVDDQCVDRPTLYVATTSYEALIRTAATAAGYPLPTETKSTPLPVEEEEDEESVPLGGGEDGPSARSSEESEDEPELDEPTKEEAPVAAGCNASPARALDGSLAVYVIAAFLAMVGRRRNNH